VHQPKQAATRDKLGHNCQLVGLHGKVVNTMPSEVQKALGNGPVLIWPLCSLNVHATLLLFIPGRCTGTEQAAIANMSGPTPSAMRCHQPHLHDCSHEEHNVGVTQACHDVNLILELLHGGGGMQQQQQAGTSQQLRIEEQERCPQQLSAPPRQHPRRQAESAAMTQALRDPVPAPCGKG
jgi:hypothetical protein